MNAKPRDSIRKNLALVAAVSLAVLGIGGGLMSRGIAADEARSGESGLPKEVATEETASKPSPEALEFFEKEVRPILANRCYECHSGSLEEPKGSLRVDSRGAMLSGGDTGPAIEPGAPDESMLIDAINYRGDYEMPPKSKLPPAEIEVLTRWVKMGAPWPDGDQAAEPNEAKKFDLAKRKAEHWAWQPVQAQPLP